MYRPTTSERQRGDRMNVAIRPTSASAKLQNSESCYRVDINRPATAALQTSQSAIAASASFDGRLLRFSEFEKAPKRERRLTLSETTGIGENAEALRRLNTPSSSNGGRIKVEERITLEQLHQIKAAFEDADTDGSGTLDINEFKTVVKKSLGIQGRNEDQIIALFMKIDSSSDGEIDWDEFCTYMQLEYAEKEEALFRSKKVLFHLPPAVSPSHIHKSTGTVLRILHIGESAFMCCSKDGLLSFWSNDLKLRKSKSIVCDTGILSSTTIKPNMWATDVAVSQMHNKIVVATGDRDIYFYDLSTLELCCRMTGFDSIPLHMDVCEIEHDFIIISYGDDQGCVGIIEMRKVCETLRLWKKAPLANNMPTVLIQDAACEENIYFVKWKVHSDWISNLKYYHELHSVVSSCNQTVNALVRGCIRPSTNIDNERALSAVSSHKQASRQGQKRHKGRYLPEGRCRQPTDQSAFTVYKGVSTFEYCKERNIIATGGMDRILRLWNPYMPHKPTGYLRGHNAPLTFVSISGADDRVFSLSLDRVVKVWDLVEQTCLVTLSQKLHKITGDIQTCTYSEHLKALAVVTDHITLLEISQKKNIRAEIPTSHAEPITCIGYNSSFSHVITCSEKSVIKLWDFETGSAMFEFNKAHGNGAVTCMTFDSSGRRLVTGGRDGAIRIWNYNNGHCLRTLMPEGQPREVATCLYLETNRNKFIAGVGWHRMINMYPDDVQDFRSIQRPVNKWQNYNIVGHKEDIVTAAYGPPNLLATASYDGIIKVWNFVSGILLSTLQFPKSDLPLSSEDQDQDNDSKSKAEQIYHAVTKLLFFKNRISQRNSASLIAACADGSLVFWQTLEKVAFAHCNVTHRPVSIGAIALLEDETSLFIGDDLGFVRVWNVEKYCTTFAKDNFTKPPPLLRGWRCHVKRITDICLIENHQVLLTSSTDCTVRIWRLTSEYIGTFGQSNHWDVYDENTWCHPMVPAEVLLDPLSMPEHPMFSVKRTLYEAVHEDSLEPSDSEEEPQEKNSSGQPLVGDLQVSKLSSRRSSRAKGGDEAWRLKLSRRLSRAMLIAPDEFRGNDDELMLNEVQRSMSKCAGKRLRHERLLSYQRHLNLHLDAGSHAFQSLKCFDLQGPMIPQEPEILVAKRKGESSVILGSIVPINEQNEELFT